MTAHTLVVGESLIDIVQRTNGSTSEHVGGSPLNVAVGLARLGHHVQLATWIGDDEHGRAIHDHLAADDVPLVEGGEVAERTATAQATLDDSGAATYTFDLDWQLPYAVPSAGRHVHTGSIASWFQPGAEQVRDLAAAHRGEGTFSFDPNVRPRLMGEPGDYRSGIEELVGLADVVKASDEDIEWLYGADAALETVARLWAQLGPSIVVVTRGADGALVVFGDEVKSVAGQKVSVTDTVGAGDSFMAGLLSGLLDADLLGDAAARDRLRAAHWDAVLPAVDRAVAVSAITVSRAGAQPPTRNELNRG
ncbi:carbohydrate kinase family protein [Calidifontibacter terrae]